MARLRIKEVAQALGWKQNALAQKSGVTEQLLNRYWNNHVMRVDLNELDKIALVLDVAPGDLIGPNELLLHDATDRQL